MYSRKNIKKAYTDTNSESNRLRKKTSFLIYLAYVNLVINQNNQANNYL